MDVVLPWHHPLRVAEDLVILDNLLAGGGRKVSIGPRTRSRTGRVQGVGNRHE